VRGDCSEAMIHVAYKGSVAAITDSGCPDALALRSARMPLEVLCQRIPGGQ
jgi:hypothetical protein